MLLDQFGSYLRVEREFGAETARDHAAFVRPLLDEHAGTARIHWENPTSTPAAVTAFMLDQCEVRTAGDSPV